MTEAHMGVSKPAGALVWTLRRALLRRKPTERTPPIYRNSHRAIIPAKGSVPSELAYEFALILALNKLP